MKTAIYARVSVKHANRKDLSIEAQIAVCKEYFKRVYIGTKGVKEAAKQETVKEKEEEQENLELLIFSDLGYSGRTMNRPAFKALQEQIVHHEISCLVVKDLSRLGRDYRLVGNFAEKILPQYSVRLLSAAEDYDSEKGSNTTAVGLAHLLNEWYARDIGRKVALVKEEKKKKGNYLGSVAPYGYQIVQREGVRRLEKEESYQVVETICMLHQKGYSSEEIAAWLLEKNINPPAVYRKSRMLIATGEMAEAWKSGTIRNLLRREAEREGY